MRWWVPSLKFDSSALAAAPGAPVMFPHLELLMGFLNYPPLAAAWVEVEDCPQPFADMVHQIKVRTQRFQGQLVGAVSRYKSMSVSYLVDLPELKTACAKGDAGGCEQASVSKKDLDDLRGALEVALNKEAEARPREIRAMLEQLPAEDREFLSSASGGFKFLNEGKGY
jgi:hypothetical protein